MPQAFHRSMNAFSRATIFGALFVLAGIGWMLSIYFRSSYATQKGVFRDQPVQFSHEHHVAGLGIDCRFCHTTVETGPFAGIPPTQTCMQCHSQVWKDSPKLAPVRDSYASGKSIPWTRVYDLPDFAYFNHSIHVQKGVACVTCHGRVDKMPLTYKAHTMQMEWCLECHRNPQDFIGPRDKVFATDWTPAMDHTTQAELGMKLVDKYHVNSLTNCSTCHR
ncbi:MAG: cytochrome c3 family protein [Planctomycetota bacterium]|nr:cytochrome c3 family protein [Planctomycetota bacterium]